MRSPKGKIISWILFLALMLSLFALLLFFQKQFSKTKPESNTEIAKPTETETSSPKGFSPSLLSEDEKENSDLNAFNDSIIKNTDCESIQFNAVLKQQCLDNKNYQAGIDKNDTKSCESIADLNLRQQCLDQVYLALSISSQSIDFCEKIIQLDLKQQCQDQAYSQIGSQAKTADECNLVKNVKLRQNCKDDFYYTNSISELNSENCNNIENAVRQKKCAQGIAQTKAIIELATESTSQAPTNVSNQQRLSTCDTEDCKQEAQFDLAFEKKDLSYCNEITDNQKKENCLEVQSVSINHFYLRQALASRDSSACNKILDPSLLIACQEAVQSTEN